MSDDRTKMLVATVQKLHSRGATHNIQKILEKTHAADIAELLEKLSPEDRFEIFLMEPDTEKRSDIFSHLEEDIQKEMLTILSKEEVLKLVSLMEKDDAADLLGNLPEDEASEILSSMVREDSREVAGLMGYPEDSAGGLMGSDYLALDQELTVKDVIEVIQKEGDEGKILFYVYVVNENDQLVGVSSLKQLLLSKRSDRLRDIMFTDVISVDVETHQEEVSKTVEKYDFLSLPVVEGNNELVGVITVDDVIDVIREEAEEDLLAMGRAGLGLNVSTLEHFKARIPWLLFAYAGGSICFAIVFLFASSHLEGEAGTLWLLAAFVPMILTLGATTGSQAATIAVGNIRSGGFDWAKAKKQFVKEATLAFMFASIFGLLTFAVGNLLMARQSLASLMGLALFVQILLAMGIGSVIPPLMSRFGVDPTVGSVPLFTALADVTAVAVLFSLYYGW